MSVFNWFRRRNEKPESTPENQPAPIETEQETVTEEAASPEAYLDWAKEAYKNIQQRRAASQASEPVQEKILETVTEESVTTEPGRIEPVQEKQLETVTEESVTTELETLVAQSTEEAVIAADLIPETVEETIASPVIETSDIAEESVIANAIAEPESVVAETVESVPESVSESVPEVLITQEIPEPVASQQEEIEEVIAAGPAWLQKSDRLEILKETAIETAVTDAPLLTETPTLDEDFLWSAKVLAAQGRSADEVSEDEINWLSRLRQGLTKTRRNLVNQLKSIVGQGPLNQEAVMEIEALLLQADVGVEATDYIINTLQTKLKEEALPPDQAIDYLKQILREILDRPFQSLSMEFVPEKEVLNIWLLTGVNGAGKTTTIGKLAHLANQSGYSCIIAAADTFRAAAVEQVQIWGDRSGTMVIANQGQNTDPAAVVFDGISAAQAKNVDLLLVDTAGRLQNKKNLMDELAKIRRIIDKKAPNAKVESLLVLDSTLGQNGLRQAEVFSQSAKLSGVVLTKLDGTSKGGVALAVTQQLNLPIRFIGAGEGIEDLRPFSSYEFVEALLNG